MPTPGSTGLDLLLPVLGWGSFLIFVLGLILFVIWGLRLLFMAPNLNFMSLILP